MKKRLGAQDEEEDEVKLFPMTAIAVPTELKLVM